MTAETWTDSLHALDLDVLQPVFPADAIRKNAGVALDDEQVFRRRGRHEADDCTRISRAKDCLTRLPDDGESIHILLSGHFRNSDFVPTILDLAGSRCERLSISTLGYDRRTVDMLLRELDGERIGRLSMLSCVYAQSHFPDLHNWLTTELDRRGSRHMAARVHVKTMAFDFPDGRRFALESSANLRSCNMCELTTITADSGLTAFHHRWIDELFEKAQAK
ncbi:MAG: hypothetical protein GXY83_37255 [Rhodopirellula sp.]|nr:hypothetical protein [Rhodopirellula sp.]